MACAGLRLHDAYDLPSYTLRTQSVSNADAASCDAGLLNQTQSYSDADFEAPQSDARPIPSVRPVQGGVYDAEVSVMTSVEDIPDEVRTVTCMHVSQCQGAYTDSFRATTLMCARILMKHTRKPEHHVAMPCVLRW